MRLNYRFPFLFICPLALIGSIACGDGGSTGDGDGDTDSAGATASGGASGGSTGENGSGGTVASGGSASGGQTAGGGGAIEASGGAEEAGGSGGTDQCTPVSRTEPMPPGAARSLGFSGTDTQYSELYNAPCTEDPDCIAPCTERGGTYEFCSNSICIHSSTDYCLPPTKWRQVDGALTEGTVSEEAAVTSLSDDDGSDQDRLVVDHFNLMVPEGATIDGISVTVRHAGDQAEGVSDQVVRIVKAGTVGTEAREKTESWPIELTNESYGGVDDLWGESWTPEAINAPDFGVAIAALRGEYGASRAYIDVVYVQVHYSVSCD